VSRIEQSGRMSLRRPKPPIKGGSAPEVEEEEEEEEEKKKEKKKKREKKTKKKKNEHVEFVWRHIYISTLKRRN
jgi:hypothetical protein